MKFHFDIGHPAHVHYFKNAIKVLKSSGNEVTVTARDRYPVFTLLKYEEIDFVDRGKGRDSFIGKLIAILEIDFFLLKLLRSKKPDCLIAFGAPYVSHVSRIFDSKSILVDDTDNARINHLFYRFTASIILSPKMFKHSFGKKHKKFDGYMELAYLDRRVFHSNSSVLTELGINENQAFVLMRFVSWNANHDIGHKGMTLENKCKAVNLLSRYGKVFISSESELPKELKQYELKLEPNKMHHLMDHATLLFGESATMASEAACLGVPAIYIDNEGRSYTDEQEKKYGIVFNFSESEEDQQRAIEKAVELVKSNDGEKFKKIGMGIQEEKVSFTDVLLETLYEIQG